MPMGRKHQAPGRYRASVLGLSRGQGPVGLTLMAGQHLETGLERDKEGKCPLWRALHHGWRGGGAGGGMTRPSRPWGPAGVGLMLCYQQGSWPTATGTILVRKSSPVRGTEQALETKCPCRKRGHPPHWPWAWIQGRKWGRACRHHWLRGGLGCTQPWAVTNPRGPTSSSPRWPSD